MFFRNNLQIYSRLLAYFSFLAVFLSPFFSDHPNRFNDKSCETIANCWPGLRKLTIGGTGITTTGLVNIAKGCLRLQELELDRSHYVTEETASSMCLAGLKGLQVLMFSFTPVSPAALRHFYGKS